jgi:hypothetical protein
MISADPTVTDPLNPQSWNRYSYVGNDPLAFKDPNGYSWLSNFFHSIGSFFKTILGNPIVRAVLQIALAAILTAAGAVAIVAAAASSAAVTGLAGGKIGDILKAAVIAGATAFAFDAVGSATKAIASPIDARLFNIAAHAGVGCLSAVASGGKCGAGALSTGVSAAASPFLSKDLAVGTAERAVVGGLASVAGGGKFENGAVTAAFGYLFNDLRHMLMGTDAHFQLQVYLSRSEPGAWEGNTTLKGLFGDSRPDLIYTRSMPYDVYEVKPEGSELEGKNQLDSYVSAAGSQAMPGDLGRIFKGPSSFTLPGGWFGEARYTYSSSNIPGVITYTVENRFDTLEQIGNLLGQRSPGMPWLPPRSPWPVPIR